MNGKSLASWLLVATLCPQALVVPSVHAQATPQPASPSVPAPLPEAASRITDVTAEVSGNRLNLGLNFASSDRPQISYARQGKTWVAILNGAQLQLKGGNASFAKANLSPDVIGVEAIQSGANQVQIRVTTAAEVAPKDALNRADVPGGMMFSVNLPTTIAQGGGTDKANTATPTATAEPPRPNTIAQNPANADTANGSGILRQQATSGANSTLNSAALFQPQITITSPDGRSRVAQTGNPTTNPAATSGNSTVPPINNPTVPQMPGRVPGVAPAFRPLTTPPVGDIATTTNRIQSETVNLGTAERVPRITLRDAPAIEVLTLIARIANLSVVSAESSTGAAAPAAGSSGGIRQPVSLDIENEPAQDVFNNILRITGLDANRIGNTVFVASRLPVTLRNLATKSYRLNQITVGEASAYLIGLGASRVVNRQRAIPGVQTATIGSASATVVNTPTESVPTLETVLIPPDSGASPLLKGLQVIAEERSNSLTLIGTPKQIEFAESQLARLDSRRRQVAVNVKVMEVQLSNNQTFNSDITLSTPGGTISTTGALGGDFFLNFATPPTGASGTQRLTLGLTAALENNRGKVLTDPTLTVQEGEEAKISLTQDVATEVTFTTVSVTINGIAQSLPAQQIKREEAGLALNIRIVRVDDNGFVTLSVSPDIKAPATQVSLGTIQGIATSYTPLSKRTLNSGQIRLRDGQTLIISGVIRDSDRQSTTKVPILGDIPLLGALFRNDQTINERSEVVIVVTPRILDDSQNNSSWGYTYQPSPETQRVLDSNQRKIQ
ncbi:MAG: secretin N-terminal domain-containing protein [Pseudanabaena sp. ELA607]